MLPASTLPSPRVTIVVPTYKEVESLPHLIDRIAAVRGAAGLDIELLIVDDDSRDGSVELVAARPEPWVQLIVRTTDRGLSQAVLEGLRHARGDVLVCMDGDLSHPPEALPARARGARVCHSVIRATSGAWSDRCDHGRFCSTTGWCDCALRT